MENQFNPFSLSGKTILITGASSGIGRQIATDVALSGAKVLLIGRDLDRLQETMSGLEGEGHAFYRYDLKDLDGIKAFITGIIQENGPLDGFVHSAGIEKTAPFKLLTPSDYETVYRVNCLSALEILRSAYTKTGFRENGSVVFIASIASLIARNGLAAYASSKGALVSAMRVMALECARRKVRVNAVSPGTILTPMMQAALDEMDPEARQKRLSGFPLGIGSVTDISNACVYLLSDAARWVTGQNLVIDGGYTME